MEMETEGGNEREKGREMSQIVKTFKHTWWKGGETVETKGKGE